MTVEEKAKSYDEALRKARQLCAYPTTKPFISDLQDIFPELKESEDEKTKRILHSILSKISFHLRDIFTEEEFQCFDAWSNAWIEKQGEKPTGKVEPKFKVGDWVVFKNKHQSTYQVEKIEDGYYILRHTHGGIFRICVLHDGSLRLWTFQDAEDGDVLVASDCSTFLLKGIDDCSCKHYVALTTNNVVKFNENFVHYWETSTAVHPATKEQRELLFTKMEENGYKWDAENKQIIKL